MSKVVEIYDWYDLQGRYWVSDDFKKLERYELGNPNFRIRSYEQLRAFLTDRMVDRGRPDRAEMLGYRHRKRAWNVWEEMGRTFGFDMDDYMWVRIPSLMPKPYLKMGLDDFHSRLNGQTWSVYGHG